MILAEALDTFETQGLTDLNENNCCSTNIIPNIDIKFSKTKSLKYIQYNKEKKKDKKG